MYRPLFVFLLFLVSRFGYSQNYHQVIDVPYYDSIQNEITQYQKKMSLLDISFPTNKEDVPVIIWFHGGGLTSGHKEIPEEIAGKGYCVVGVGYRLSPKVKAETSVKDAAEAVAWVFKNIEKYNGDPDKIYISGHSAGGYLALMTVMNRALLKKYSIDANKVAGLVPFSGHTITHFTIRKERGIPGEQPIIDEWAPLYFVRKEAPPILLITGDREKEMLGRYEENAYFYRMMKVNGHSDISIYEMDGYGHLMTTPAFPLLLNFISDHENN